MDLAAVIAGVRQGILQSTGVERDVIRSVATEGGVSESRLVTQNLLLGLDSGWMTGLWTTLVQEAVHDAEVLSCQHLAIDNAQSGKL